MPEIVMPGVWRGHAITDGEANRGWVVGDQQPTDSPLHTQDVRFKFDLIQIITTRPRALASAEKTHRTLQILVSGQVTTSFLSSSANPADDVHVELTQPGDTCIWDPGIVHYWEVNPGPIGDALVLTLRWPV